jgi:hypothetical protein
MNWVTLTKQNLRLKRSARFLLIFSACSLAVAGAVWACAFEDDSSSSVFSPEAFVSKQYTPFSYDSEHWYYGGNVEISDNNNRFNSQVINEWDGYLNHTLSRSALRYLLLSAGKGGVDSVNNYITGKLKTLKQDTLHINVAGLDKNKIASLFNYLKLAKDCETFAVGEDRDWYNAPKQAASTPIGLEKSLSTAFTNSKDAFIKERLWFQLARYYFFNDDTATASGKRQVNTRAKMLVLFDKYKSTFPQNLTYYRTLGYVAGYYRRKGDFALSNYLYSRCYDFSFEMKIPSKFSFRAQQEADWRETLALAKNKEEKITLWHMLGMEYDPVRAIKAIAALDARTDKMDLLLSRLVNSREPGDNSTYFIPRLQNQGDGPPVVKENDKIALKEINLVDSIAKNNNTAKPYFWNIAAGYLYYMHGDYIQAGNFYAAAKTQMPANDKLIMAQYKMLTIFLDVDRLKHIDAQTEAKLVEPLNWLKDLQDGHIHIDGLRPGLCSGAIARVFLNQRDSLKADCFTDTIVSYANDAWVQKFINMMNKPNKTPFEKTMLRYYPHTLDELYYHQAASLVYTGNIDKAITLMGKAIKTSKDTLPGNPFNSRLNDCHDCDHAAPQKQKFTALTFLKTLQKIKADLAAGTDTYRNASFLANAYYNITYYGNARQFYQDDVFKGIDINDQKIPEKYYLLARKYAQTDEQKAKCTFMASKCERNEYYNNTFGGGALNTDDVPPPPAGKYFKELKGNYAQTAYYKEVLRECGYFKSFVNAKN